MPHPTLLERLQEANQQLLSSDSPPTLGRKLHQKPSISDIPVQAFLNTLTKKESTLAISTAFDNQLWRIAFKLLDYGFAWPKPDSRITRRLPQNIPDEYRLIIKLFDNLSPTDISVGNENNLEQIVKEVNTVLQDTRTAHLLPHTALCDFVLQRIHRVLMQNQQGKSNNYPALCHLLIQLIKHGANPYQIQTPRFHPYQPASKLASTAAQTEREFQALHTAILVTRAQYLLENSGKISYTPPAEKFPRPFRFLQQSLPSTAHFPLLISPRQLSGNYPHSSTQPNTDVLFCMAYDQGPPSVKPSSPLHIRGACLSKVKRQILEFYIPRSESLPHVQQALIQRKEQLLQSEDEVSLIVELLEMLAENHHSILGLLTLLRYQNRKYSGQSPAEVTYATLKGMHRAVYALLAQGCTWSKEIHEASIRLQNPKANELITRVVDAIELLNAKAAADKSSQNPEFRKYFATSYPGENPTARRRQTLVALDQLLCSPDTHHPFFPINHLLYCVIDRAVLEFENGAKHPLFIEQLLSYAGRLIHLGGNPYQALPYAQTGEASVALYFREHPFLLQNQEARRSSLPTAQPIERTAYLRGVSYVLTRLFCCFSGLFTSTYSRLLGGEQANTSVTQVVPKVIIASKIDPILRSSLRLFLVASYVQVFFDNADNTHQQIVEIIQQRRLVPNTLGESPIFLAEYPFLDARQNPDVPGLLNELKLSEAFLTQPEFRLLREQLRSKDENLPESISTQIIREFLGALAGQEAKYHMTPQLQKRIIKKLKLRQAQLPAFLAGKPTIDIHGLMLSCWPLLLRSNPAYTRLKNDVFLFFRQPDLFRAELLLSITEHRPAFYTDPRFQSRILEPVLQFVARSAGNEKLLVALMDAGFQLALIADNPDLVGKLTNTFRTFFKRLSEVNEAVQAGDLHDIKALINKETAPQFPTMSLMQTCQSLKHNSAFVVSRPLEQNPYQQVYDYLAAILQDSNAPSSIQHKARRSTEMMRYLSEDFSNNLMSNPQNTHASSSTSLIH